MTAIPHGPRMVKVIQNLKVKLRLIMLMFIKCSTQNNSEFSLLPIKNGLHTNRCCLKKSCKNIENVKQLSLISIRIRSKAFHSAIDM